MKYEDFIENYTPELQLIDALDLLQRDQAIEAAEILEKLGVGSTDERNNEERNH